MKYTFGRIMTLLDKTVVLGAISLVDADSINLAESLFHITLRHDHE